MTNYVAGFLFSTDMGQLVLVEKKHPEWQAGKMNGVGGKIEEGETPHDAMVREFREETGKEVPEWTQFCTLQCRYATVYFFYAVAKDYNKVETITDEEILLWDVDYVMDTRRQRPLPSWLVQLNELSPMGPLFNDNNRPDVVPNLRWLIQMARSFSMGEGAKEFIVTEVYHESTSDSTP